MKIIILTQYYPPEIGAPQRRLSQLAEALVNAGHRVTVLTAMPSYPLGKIYRGYGGLIKTEELNGVRIIRTWIYPTQSTGVVRRLLNYISFTLSSLLLGGWFLKRSDYLITESPPLFLGLSGFALSWLTRARFIFNVSDLWPESAVRLGMLKNTLALSAMKTLEAFCYNRAWLVTGQSQSIIDDIRRRFPRVKTYLFSNGVDTQCFRPDCVDAGTRLSLLRTADCVALYAGLHGLGQGLEQVVQAAELIRDRQPLQIVLLGDGPTKAALIEEASSRHLTNLQFRDSVAASEMSRWIAAADIALVVLKTYIPGAVPSKLYEAMAAGVPIILVAEGEPAEIVERHKAGVVISPGDIHGLADALVSLSCDPLLRKFLGSNGRYAAVHFYDRGEICNRFAGFLEEYV